MPVRYGEMVKLLARGHVARVNCGIVRVYPDQFLSGCRQARALVRGNLELVNALSGIYVQDTEQGFAEQRQRLAIGREHQVLDSTLSRAFEPPNLLACGRLPKMDN